VFTFQARWRGAVVRDSMRQVCRDYAAIFNEIEEKPSCAIEWQLAKCAVVGKPQFIPLDRRNRVRLDAVKSEDPLMEDLRLTLSQNCSDKQRPVSSGLDCTEINSEFFTVRESSVSEPEPENETSGKIRTTELSSVSVKQQEHEVELDVCSVGDCQNSEHVSVDRTIRYSDYVTVGSGTLRVQENSQQQTAELQGTF